MTVTRIRHQSARPWITPFQSLPLDQMRLQGRLWKRCKSRGRPRFSFSVIFIIALAFTAGAVLGDEASEYEIVDIELMEEAAEQPINEEAEDKEIPETPEPKENISEARSDLETKQSDAGSEEIKAGFTALQNHDYSTAYNIFHSLALQDNVIAQYELGALYHRGLGVGKDVVRASHWYTRAAEQGNADAQYRLGNMYLMGEGVRQSDSEASYWYEKAVQQGHTDAKHNLASIQRISKAKTREELEREAAALPPDDRVETPDPVEKTAAGKGTTEKRGFFTRLLGGGDKTVSDGSSVLLPESNDPEDEMPSPDAPVDILEPESSADRAGTDLVSAVTDDADDDASGLTASSRTKPDKKKKGFFSRLFGKDDKEDETTPGSTNPARPGQAGTDGDDASPGLAVRDDETAQPGPDKASLNPLERSGAVSNYELGMAYVLGGSIEQDHTKAFEHFVRSAKQGYAPAQYRLGMAYAHGEGTGKDLSKAVEWYEKSALQGHAIAQRSLGMMYLNGQEGMERNKPLALAWYSLLAEDGNQMDTHRRDTLLRELSAAEIQTSEELKTELQNRLAAGEVR